MIFLSKNKDKIKKTLHQPDRLFCNVWLWRLKILVDVFCNDIDDFLFYIHYTIVNIKFNRFWLVRSFFFEKKCDFPFFEKIYITIRIIDVPLSIWSWDNHINNIFMIDSLFWCNKRYCHRNCYIQKDKTLLN